MILVDRRTARRQAESRDVGNDRRRAAAGAATGRRSPCSVPGAASAASPRSSPPREVAGGRHRRARRRSSRTRRTATPRRSQAADRRSCSRRIVLLPHTYQTRDFAPKLAARLDRALITDVTAIKSSDGERRLRAADVPGQADRRRRAARARRRTSSRSRSARSAPIRPRSGAAPAPIARARRDRRRRPRSGRSRRRRSRKRSRRWTCRRPSGSSSVGRGIKEQEHLPLAEQLAAGARRRARRVAPDLRRRLAADGAPGRQLRARPSRRSCTSRSASPARFSTSSA